jgi:GNAT superfamily N-acetyltransferase
VGLRVRPRTADDLDVLLALLQRTHEQEGYPVRAEAVSAAWLTSADEPGWPSRPELGGWVAVAGERVLGHVALHPAGGPCLPLGTAGAGRCVDELAVVSRLFTDRTVRGAGTALLAHAVAVAGLAGRRAVLEVDALSPAYGLYLRQGWRDAGRTPQQWGHRRVDSAALVAPSG